MDVPVRLKMVFINRLPHRVDRFESFMLPLLLFEACSTKQSDWQDHVQLMRGAISSLLSVKSTKPLDGGRFKRNENVTKCNFDHISHFFCLCLNCICSMDLNNSRFEFGFISDSPIIIRGHIFYCDCRFNDERTERETSQGGWTMREDSCLREALFLPITSQKRKTPITLNESPDH